MATSGIRITKDTAARVLAQYPGIRQSVVPFGEGGDFVVFRVGDLIFRFPKREDYDHLFVVEMSLLDWIAPQLPLPVPQYCYRGKPCEDYPYHFGGYPALMGIRLMDVGSPSAEMLDVVAPQLGAFLRALHHVDVRRTRELGVHDGSDNDSMEAVRQCALEDLAMGPGIIPPAWHDRCHAYFEDKTHVPADYTGAPCLVHTDFGYEHILVDPSSHTVTGILDWSDVAIGDPSWDFARLWAWQGDAFLCRVLEGYQSPDERIRERVHYRGLATAVSFCYGEGNDTEHHDYQRSGLTFLNRILKDSGLLA